MFDMDELAWNMNLMVPVRPVIRSLQTESNKQAKSTKIWQLLFRNHSHFTKRKTNFRNLKELGQTCTFAF